MNFAGFDSNGSLSENSFFFYFPSSYWSFCSKEVFDISIFAFLNLNTIARLNSSEGKSEWGKSEGGPNYRIHELHFRLLDLQTPIMNNHKLLISKINNKRIIFREDRKYAIYRFIVNSHLPISKCLDCNLNKQRTSSHSKKNIVASIHVNLSEEKSYLSRKIMKFTRAKLSVFVGFESSVVLRDGTKQMKLNDSITSSLASESFTVV